jgi:hypothetical protein
MKNNLEERCLNRLFKPALWLNKPEKQGIFFGFLSRKGGLKSLHVNAPLYRRPVTILLILILKNNR